MSLSFGEEGGGLDLKREKKLRYEAEKSENKDRKQDSKTNRRRKGVVKKEF